MTVGEISNETVTTAADDTVIAAAELMDSEGTNVIVVEDNGTVEGIVIDREIALAVAEQEGNLSDITVEKVMTEEVVTLQEDDKSLTAVREMPRRAFGRSQLSTRRDRWSGLSRSMMLSHSLVSSLRMPPQSSKNNHLASNHKMGLQLASPSSDCDNGDESETRQYRT
jgi:predicted transcriptional regulator